MIHLIVGNTGSGKTTYANKLKKDEANIDWSKSILQIDRQIRAFNQYPVAQTTIDSGKFTGKTLRILNAEVVAKTGNKIYQDKSSLIIDGDDFGLSLKTVQLAGKKPVTIKDFNNSYKITNIY